MSYGVGVKNMRYDTRELFQSFIHTFKDEDGHTIYWNRVKSMPVHRETSLVVDFQDLVNFNDIFERTARKKPIALQNDLNSALVSVLMLEDSGYVRDRVLEAFHLLEKPAYQHENLEYVKERALEIFQVHIMEME